MACHITITSIIGTGGPTPTSITVTGTAVDCPSGMVIVTLACPPHGVKMIVPVMANGSWTAVFQNTADLGCECGELASAVATCDGTEVCTMSFPADKLKCESPPCPTVVSLSATLGGCADPTSGSSATATFTATLMPPLSGCSFSWHFDDGTPDVTTTTPTTTHTYTLPGLYFPTVTVNCVVAGTPCVNMATTMLNVPPCECPTITNLTVTVQGCADPNTSPPSSATATFTATLMPPLPGCSFLWSFGDGNHVTTTTPTTTHTYTLPNPSYAAAVTSICPGPCYDQATVTVNVPRCCPVVTGITSTLQDNECADGSSHTATLNFAAVTDPPNAAGTYTWDFGDGSPPPPPNLGPLTSHSYTTPGMYSVHVTYTPNPFVFLDCPPRDLISPVSVPACAGGGDGGRGGGCLCNSLVWIAFALILISAILAVLAVCLHNLPMGIVAGILFLIAWVFFLLWYLICAHISSNSCHLLNVLECIVTWIITITPILALIIYLFTGNFACGLAVLATEVEWGLFLVAINEAQKGLNCPPSSSCF